MAIKASSKELKSFLEKNKLDNYVEVTGTRTVKLKTDILEAEFVGEAEKAFGNTNVIVLPKNSGIDNIPETFKYGVDATYVGNNSWSGTYNTIVIKDGDMLYALKIQNPNASKGPAAADFEIGIVMAYNLRKFNDDEKKAMDKAELAGAGIKTWNKWRDELLEFGNKTIDDDKFPKSSSHMIWTGAKIAKSNKLWNQGNGGKNDTPKTDLMFADKSYLISLKMGGKPSQLASGNLSNDGVGILDAALQYYKEKPSKSSVILAKELVNTFEQFSGNIKAGSSNTLLKKKLISGYTEFRKKNIDKKIHQNYSKKAIEDHIKQELRDANLINDTGGDSKLITDIKPLSKVKVFKWFKSYTKTLPEVLGREMDEVLTRFADNKQMSNTLNKLMEDIELKKYCIYEAATGLYKFTGQTEMKNNTGWEAANSVLVFTPGGGVNKFEELTTEWAKKYTSSVNAMVGFKSAGRSKFSSFRLLFEQVTEVETGILLEELEESYDEILSEGIFSKIKDITKNILSKLWDMFKKAVFAILIKVFSVLLTWADKGWMVLCDKMGWETVPEKLNIGEIPFR